MRFDLIDLLFAIVAFATGTVLGGQIVPFLPPLVHPMAQVGGGIFFYMVVIYPFYRGLRRFPMILPRCPCCGEFQIGFHIIGGQWPRIEFRCPTCNGEFVIWHDGKPAAQETWLKPVLALKWPYAFGIYKRMKKPEHGEGGKASPATS